MKLSTKGRYGVLALYDLALNYGSGPISLKGIAERQGISENYLEQLMVPLRKAGFVNSVRGAQGGYTLSREPKEISIGEIIVAMEGPIAFADCMLLQDGEPFVCKKADGCGRKNVWAKIGARINDVLNSITLEELCSKPQK